MPYLGGDYTDWPLDAMVRKMCSDARLIVVMPTIRDYTSMQKCANYMKYAGEELPKFISFALPVSAAKEDTFIAGFSYGGYYAYRVAMNYPDVFGCVGSFGSPVDVVMDIQRLHSNHPSSPKYTDVMGTERDILWVSKKLKESGHFIPKMFQTVGREDFTWDFNVSAREHFKSLGLDHAWDEGPGTHSLEYATEHFHVFLDWLPLKKKAFIPKESK